MFFLSPTTHTHVVKRLHWTCLTAAIALHSSIHMGLVGSGNIAFHQFYLVWEPEILLSCCYWVILSCLQSIILQLKFTFVMLNAKALYSAPRKKEKFKHTVDRSHKEMNFVQILFSRNKGEESTITPFSVKESKRKNKQKFVWSMARVPMNGSSLLWTPLYTLRPWLSLPHSTSSSFGPPAEVWAFVCPWPLGTSPPFEGSRIAAGWFHTVKKCNLKPSTYSECGI